MVTLPTTSLRAIRGTPEDRAFWLDWIRSVAPQTPLHTLKATPTVGVYAADTPRGPIVLKCWRLSTLAHRAYAALRATRGARHWRGTARLAALGLLAPRCHALIRGNAGGQAVEVLIMERIQGRTLLDHMARTTLGVGAQHRVARALARQCATMSRGGVFNRDHKPSNLVVVGADREHARIAVLDAVAIRPLTRRAARHAPPLERLVLEAIGVGACPRRALMARFVHEWVGLALPRADHRAARRDLWRTLGARIASHGDPTPTDNPLTTPV